MVKHMTPLERAYLEPLAPTTGTSLADAERDALRRAAKDSAKDSIREGFGEESADRSAATLDVPSVWIPSPDRETRRGVDAGDADRGSIEDPRRGRDEAESRRRDAWLRRVVGALLPIANRRFCDSASRRAAHAPLAEILLPAALADLAAHHAEGGRVHRAVSAGVAACLKSDGEDARGSSSDALGVGRRSRATRRRATASRDDQIAIAIARKRRRTRIRGATRGTARGAADGAPASPEARRRAYWVDVDYLVAAAAALRARAAHRRVARGDVVRGSTRHGVARRRCRRGARTRRRDAPPRGGTGGLGGRPGTRSTAPRGAGGPLRAGRHLRPVATHALPIQMRLYEHEGAWSQALAGHDAALRRAEGERASGFGGADARARLVDTLRRMGCLHVLDVYVRSLPAEEAAAPEIAEARFEAAWRAGRWDLPPRTRRRRRRRRGSTRTRTRVPPRLTRRAGDASRGKRRRRFRGPGRHPRLARSTRDGGGRGGGGDGPRRGGSPSNAGRRRRRRSTLERVSTRRGAPAPAPGTRRRRRSIPRGTPRARGSRRRRRRASATRGDGAWARSGVDRTVSPSHFWRFTA